MMERVNGILKDPLYRTCLSKIALFERDRIFCGHDMAHFLDVARLAYIFNLEENLGIEKEEIYTALFYVMLRAVFLENQKRFWQF